VTVGRAFLALVGLFMVVVTSARVNDGVITAEETIMYLLVLILLSLAVQRPER
jgi:hypothetical protein